MTVRRVFRPEPYLSTSPTFEYVTDHIDSYVSAWEDGEYSHVIETIIGATNFKPARRVYLSALLMHKLKRYDQTKFLCFLANIVLD